MSRLIDAGLEEQSALLCKMAELTYETVDLAIQSYLSGESAHRQVQEMSELLMAMAEEIEDKTFELISRFQPVASDLRTIKSYMKIAYDFSRYSRYALDISYVTDKLCGITECETWMRSFIQEVSEKVMKMVRISIDSLRKYDVALAKTVSTLEQEVDKIFIDYLNRLIEKVNVDPKCVISSVLVMRYLERIADHATYVCEAIVYIATGEKILLR
ncbi:MAG: phosphate uptake regulator, PhoU [Candidatus Bathyarchaeota archaeon]|nr:phosphate uptake regulator, PhoU [Candidatus Bathyarchaeota archaeon]